MDPLLIVLIGVGLLLLCLKPVWVIGLGLAGLVAIFTAIASIIHFQILQAVAFFVLGMFLMAFASVIADTL